METTETEEVTTTSQLVGIIPGDPPRLNLVDHASGRNGVKRHFTRQTPVRDEKLFAELMREVSIGDHFRATTVNEYGEAGIQTYLSDFKKLPPAEQEAPAKNGAFPLVHSESREMMVSPSVQDRKNESKILEVSR